MNLFVVKKLVTSNCLLCYGSRHCSIGATRDVVMEVSPNESGPNILCIEVAETDSTNRKCFQVERAKLIMRNFVLIRYLNDTANMYLDRALS